MEDSNKVFRRDEIDAKYKWDLEAIFPNLESFNNAIKEVEAMIPEIKATQGTLSKSASNLLFCLEKNDEMLAKMIDVFVYARMKRDEDTGLDSAQALTENASLLLTKVTTANAFIVPEITNIEENVLKGYIDEEKGLSLYNHFLMNIQRQKEHILSNPIETLLSSAQEVFETSYEIFSMFNNADISFEDITLPDGTKGSMSNGKFIRYLENPNRSVRESAYNSMYNSFYSMKNTLAKTYVGNVKKNVFLAKTRKYPSALAYALNDDHIPESVYLNLIKVIDDAIPTYHKYLELRKKQLNLDSLKMYDVYVPIVKTSMKSYSYEEAKELVIKALSPLGEQYISDLKSGFGSGWIDVYENKGKRSGAYSWGSYHSHPYVLLNFQGTVNDVFTIAHEMGHAMHTFYSNKSQDFVNSEYPIFLAEVASTTNELLLMDYMLKNSDDNEEKAYLLNHFLEEFRTTVFRQTMFAEFEWSIHNAAWNGIPLTTEFLSQTYYELVNKHFGKVVDLDELISYEWSRIPHFYTSFYVYKYATGFSAAVSLSNMLLKNIEGARSNYLTFLSSGGSDYPLTLLKNAGVDLSTQKPIKDGMDTFSKILDELTLLLEEA